MSYWTTDNPTPKKRKPSPYKEYVREVKVWWARQRKIVNIWWTRQKEGWTRQKEGYRRWKIERTGSTQNTPVKKKKKVVRRKSRRKIKSTNVIQIVALIIIIGLFGFFVLSPLSPLSFVTNEGDTTYTDDPDDDYIPLMKTLQWDTTEQLGYGSETLTNTTLIQSGLDGSIVLTEKGNNVSSVPFDTPSNYDYDSDIIEVSSGSAKLKSISGSGHDWEFDEALDYEYDSELIDVDESNGYAYLKGNSKCIEQDDSGEHISVSDQVAEGMGKITVSAWINQPSFGTSDVIFDNYYGAGQRPVFFVTYSGNLRALINDGSWCIGSTTMTIDTWYHVALTYSYLTTTITLYLNGEVDGTLGKAGYLHNSPDPDRIGRYFGGMIDEVSVWDEDLSLTQIRELYNDGRPTIVSEHSAYSDCLAWWRLGDGDDEDNFPDFTDEKGGHTGTYLNPEYDEIVDAGNLKTISTLNPTITSDSWTYTGDLNSFTESVNTELDEDGVKYQISDDGGTTWKYWNNTNWTPIKEELDSVLNVHMEENTGTNISDSSSNEFHGSTVNMEEVDWDYGQLGHCLEFDGVDEYVDFGNVLDFERNDTYSLEAWFNCEGSNLQTIMGKLIYSGNYEGYFLTLSSTDGHISFGMVHDTSPANRIQAETSGTDYRDSAWHHIVATYDGSSDANGMSVFVDGINQSLSITHNTLTDSTISPANFQIGARNGSSLFEGRIDEVCVYNFTLTQEDVNYRYELGQGLYYYNNESNVASTVSANINNLTTDGTLKIKTFLHSYNGTYSPQLDNIHVEDPSTVTVGSYIISMDTDIQPDAVSQWIEASETVLKPSNTDIKYQYSINSGSSWSDSWLNVSELQNQISLIITDMDGFDTIRLRIQLSTTDGTETPIIYNIDITANRGVENEGVFISGWFEWTEYVVFRTLNFSVVERNGCDYEIYVRFSQEFIDPLSAFQEGIDEKVYNVAGNSFQFKIEFTSDGRYTPTFEWLEMRYWINVVHLV